ncbi:MAG TPA: TldD/PmbA family protein [bacterium]|nr:TldD/PmbA family protein [bacterium]
MADNTGTQLFKMLDPGFEAEFIQEDTRTLATRVSENAIQANTSVRERDAWVRVFRDGRIGTASGLVMSDEDIGGLVMEALSDWKKSTEPSAVVPAPDANLPFNPVADPDIRDEDPLRRAERLGHAVSIIRKHGLEFTGAYTTKVIQRRLLSTAGADFTAEHSLADVSCTIQGAGSGWARVFSTRADDVRLPDLVRTAGGKALNSARPEPLKPGRYTVILEPAAVGSMLLFLGFLSFGGRSYNRGTSFLSGKIGEKVMADHMTIEDDAADTRMDGWPFDYEGTPVRKVMLVEKGIARGVVHDMTTAENAKAASTGHALAPGNNFGPYPRCVHMHGGKTPLPDVFASVENGILVTRLWYINYVNPMRSMITGTTRDGTFEIRNGKPVRAVSEMRFVESILEAFNRSVLLSRETRYIRQFGSTLRVPWMVIPDFEFTEVI